MGLTDTHVVRGFRGAFAERIKRVEDQLLENLREKVGVDISKHSPEDLQTVDRLIGGWFREEARSTESKYQGAIIALGTFLGEVFVSNLGGQWHFPSWSQDLIILASRDRFKAERFCYVTLGNQRVNVFGAVRDAIDGTAERVSLYQYYQDYSKAAGGSIAKTSQSER